MWALSEKVGLVRQKKVTGSDARNWRNNPNLVSASKWLGCVQCPLFTHNALFRPSRPPPPPPVAGKIEAYASPRSFLYLSALLASKMNLYTACGSMPHQHEKGSCFSVEVSDNKGLVIC